MFDRLPLVGEVTWPGEFPGELSAPTSGGGTTLYPDFTLAGTGPFTIGVQVRDVATDAAVAARYWVRFTLGTTEWAADTADVVTMNTGLVLQYVGDAVYDVLTDENGVCEIETDAAADRYVSAAVGAERAYSTGLLEYVSVTPPGTGESMGLLLALTYA